MLRGVESQVFIKFWMVLLINSGQRLVKKKISRSGL